MIFNHYKDIEEKLRKTAALMPKPTKPVPVSPVMEKRRQAGKTDFPHGLRTGIWHMPAWRIAVIALLVFIVSSTTILAASPKLRTAIARFFSSGVTETIPIDDLNPKKSAPATASPDSREDASGQLSGKTIRQTVGGLSLIQDVTLDSHFTASYVSSSDYLALEKTSSGMPLISACNAKGKTSYYSMAGGNLKEIHLKAHTKTASVHLGRLPGVMAYHGGKGKKYRKLALPTMKFDLSWRQNGSDILIDHGDSENRFDIGSTYGIHLKDDYDGQFLFQELRGRDDIVEVLFCLDGQETGYQYPFLLNLTTGKVSDPLASVDLSDWACITELSIHDDMATATAMAGSSHEDLREITIDLNTGAITAEIDPDSKTPSGKCVVKFPVGKDVLFYVVGTEERGDGYLYNTKTGDAKILFKDAADYSLWGSNQSFTSYWSSIGHGYLVYYADHKVSLINLKDGGKMTVLEDIPMKQDIDFFINNEGTVLSIVTPEDNSFDATRLCLMDLKTMEAWYFDRNLPREVEEGSRYWNGEYGFVIDAQNTETGTNYIYLYQYTP